VGFNAVADNTGPQCVSSFVYLLMPPKSAKSREIQEVLYEESIVAK